MGASGTITDIPMSGCGETKVDDPAASESFPITEAALVRKIDWRIVPTLFLAYFLQFLDKVAINTATAFFIGYVVAEWPQGVLLRHFPISKVLGCNIFAWGITLCCSAACHDTPSIIAVRTLLGVCEAVIAPALIVFTSRWYTKTEAPLRYGIWYCGLGAGQIVGGLISFGAQHSSSVFTGWRVMFICIGVFNILVALLILFTLPDNPGEAQFLGQNEKELLEERLGWDESRPKPEELGLHLLRELLLDPQTWLLVLLTLCITIPSGVITTFSATLIHSFGYNSKQSALLNVK
ncbi:MFS general substrate transporter, partial [Aureobasidium sp. EXF-3399]